ncbi:hypothetical protein ACQ4PT_050983 [Festuca glaucescens]
MKLLVDSGPPCPRVVFAEARKDAVDFLFSLLSMPTGTALKLLGNESMVGCIGNLYTSIEKLDAHFQPGATKDAILTPTVLSPAAKSNRSFFRLPEPSPAMKRFFGWGGYTYSSSRNYVTEERGARCPMCGSERVSAGRHGDSQYVSSEHLTQEAKGIALINTVAVSDLGALQERTVQLGYKEGVEILKTSLQSNTVLTDVFLGKKT